MGSTFPSEGRRDDARSEVQCQCQLRSQRDEAEAKPDDLTMIAGVQCLDHRYQLSLAETSSLDHQLVDVAKLQGVQLVQRD